MKQLFFCVVLLAVLGVAGFLYRSTLEGPLHGTNMSSSTNAVACQADAKVCPDGSSVGRSGPSCQFAACALPNVEIPAAGIAFVLPAGYKADSPNPGDTSLLSAYEKLSVSGSNSAPDALVTRRFPIPDDKDANTVMLEETMYESSGMQPSIQDFKPVIINGKTYQMLVIERFEAVVHVVYYLPREHDVLRFEALQHNVTNWTDPALNVRTLPAVSALESLLGTLQSNEPGA